jgi:hypothetical protein
MPELREAMHELGIDPDDPVSASYIEAIARQADAHMALVAIQLRSTSTSRDPRALRGWWDSRLRRERDLLRRAIHTSHARGSIPRTRPRPRSRESRRRNVRRGPRKSRAPDDPEPEPDLVAAPGRARGLSSFSDIRSDIRAGRPS